MSLMFLQAKMFHRLVQAYKNNVVKSLSLVGESASHARFGPFRSDIAVDPVPEARFQRMLADSAEVLASCLHSQSRSFAYQTCCRQKAL